MAPRYDECLKYGFMDCRGEWVIFPHYDEALDFSEGLAAVKTADVGWFFIDKNGNKVLEAERSIIDLMRFTEGLAAAQLINGEVTIPLKTHETGISGWVRASSGWGPGIGEQTHGRHWGFIDKSGQFVIHPQYDSVGEFHESLAPVLLNKKWGYLGPNGMALDASFDQARIFSSGLAAVRRENKFGYIDKTGAIKIPPRFDKAYDFENGAAVVYDGKTSLAIDVTGSTIAEDFHNHQSSKIGLFMSHGSRIRPKFEKKSRRFKVTAIGNNIFYRNKSIFTTGPVSYFNRNGAVEIEVKLPKIPKDALVFMDEFRDGYGLVYVNSGYRINCYICDVNGNVTKASADQIFSFSEGLARIRG